MLVWLRTGWLIGGKCVGLYFLGVHQVGLGCDWSGWISLGSLGRFGFGFGLVGLGWAGNGQEEKRRRRKERKKRRRERKQSHFYECLAPM